MACPSVRRPLGASDAASDFLHSVGDQGPWMRGTRDVARTKCLNGGKGAYLPHTPHPVGTPARSAATDGRSPPLRGYECECSTSEA